MIFDLNGDLNLPVSKYETRVFSSAECGISYVIHNSNPSNKEIQISLVVIAKDTNSVLYTLGSRYFTEAGRQSQTNTAEVAASQTARQVLLSELSDLEGQYASAGTEEDKAIIQVDMDAKRVEIQNFSLVLPEYETVDTWDEIVSTINIDGTVTAEGLAWAATSLKVGDVPLGDVIVI